jgi:hypothetical protein
VIKNLDVRIEAKVSDISKGRVYQHYMEKSKLVKVINIVEGVGYNPPIVVLRDVFPDYGIIIGFEFTKNSKEFYITLEEMEERYRWFVVDEEIMAKIRMGVL